MPAHRLMASPPGQGERLDHAVSEFGLWDLPPDAYLLTRAAVTLGAHLAPMPFVSATPAQVAARRATRVANGVDRAVVPAVLPRVVVAVGLRCESVPRQEASDSVQRENPLCRSTTFDARACRRQR